MENEKARKYLIKKDVPYPQSQRKRKGVREDGDEPLTCIHAWVDHLLLKVRTNLWHQLFNQPLKLEEILLNQWETNLQKKQKQAELLSWSSVHK